MEFSKALPGWFPLGQTGQILPASFSTLGKLVPAAESAWKLFSLLLDQVWWWVSKWTRSGCWNSQKHEFMTVCKVVSQFPICSLNINAGYKSVRLKVRGLCLQCALPGVLLLMNSVIYPCWGLRTFGKLIYCELTGMTAGEECLEFLLACSFGRSVRWLASFQLYRVFLGGWACGVGEGLEMDLGSQPWNLVLWL